MLRHMSVALYALLVFGATAAGQEQTPTAKLLTPEQIAESPQGRAVGAYNDLEVIALKYRDFPDLGPGLKELFKATVVSGSDADDEVQKQLGKYDRANSHLLVESYHRVHFVSPKVEGRSE